MMIPCSQLANWGHGWRSVLSWNIFLVFFKTVHIISGLYLSLQDVLKFHVWLYVVVVEETTCIYQVKEHFREIILKGDSPFLTSAAVRSWVFILASSCSISRCRCCWYSARLLSFSCPTFPSASSARSLNFSWNSFCLWSFSRRLSSLCLASSFLVSVWSS